VDPCPYCGANIAEYLLMAFDDSTEETVFRCPFCRNRMMLRLGWMFGNSLHSIHAETIGDYARQALLSRLGFLPTQAEMEIRTKAGAILK